MDSPNQPASRISQTFGNGTQTNSKRLITRLLVEACHQADGSYPLERWCKTKVSFNQVVFAGNVGKDPELQTTPSEKSYARFSLAVDTSFSKEDKEAPMWLNVVAWNTLAEQVKKIVKKGSLVLVSGLLSVRTYKDKEEATRSVTEVIANSIQVLPMQKAKEVATAEQADA